MFLCVVAGVLSRYHGLVPLIVHLHAQLVGKLTPIYNALFQKQQTSSLCSK